MSGRRVLGKIGAFLDTSPVCFLFELVLAGDRSVITASLMRCTFHFICIIMGTDSFFNTAQALVESTQVVQNFVNRFGQGCVVLVRLSRLIVLVVALDGLILTSGTWPLLVALGLALTAFVACLEVVLDGEFLIALVETYLARPHALFARVGVTHMHCRIQWPRVWLDIAGVWWSIMGIQHWWTRLVEWSISHRVMLFRVMWKRR